MRWVTFASAALTLYLLGCGDDRSSSKTPPPSFPDAPTNLSATGGCYEITLTWTPVTGAIGYNLYWQTVPGVDRTSQRIPGVTSGFVHTGLTNGTTYYYAVAAFDSIGEGDLSDEISGATIPLSVPALPPDTFTRVDTLTSRNPTLQTPFLQQPKDSMTATTLPQQCGGLVVLIGGSSGGITALQETEIYDQRTAEFSLSGLLGNGRRHHTATLTPVGDIVVIGGVRSGAFDPAPLQSAEVWRSATGTYSVVQQMVTPRVGHTATLLASGEILAAGGFTDTVGQKVTDSAESLNLLNGLWRQNTPLQATTSVDGTPRAYHSATAIPGPNGILGDGDDLLLVIGGVLGDRGSRDITTITNSVLVFYPNETTRLMSGQTLPGAWRTVGISGAIAEPARIGHESFFIGINTTFSQVAFLGGLSGSLPTRFGGIAAGAAGFSLIEDSPAANLSMAVLDIDNTTLIGLPTLPQGEINQVYPLGDPNCCQSSIGGIGANAVFSPARLAIIYSGGNSFSSPPPTRTGYNRNGMIITMSRGPTGYITIDTPGPCLACGNVIATSSGQMGDLRSWHASARLPGADGILNTPDDTVLLAGGEQSPSGETSTADEYTFP